MSLSDGFTCFSKAFAQQREKLIFDGFVSSATDTFRNLFPAVPVDFVQPKQVLILRFGPFADNSVWICYFEESFYVTCPDIALRIF